MGIIARFYGQAERLSIATDRLCKRHGYQKKVAFMHIPKCAGSSIMESLRKNRPAAWQGHVDCPKTRRNYLNHLANTNSSFIDREHAIYQYRQSLLLEKFEQGCPIISGHVPFLRSLKDSYSDYYFFTVIRNPVTRWLSYFNFCLEKDMHETISMEIVKAKGIKYALDVVMDSETGIFESRLLSLFFSESSKQQFSLNSPVPCDNHVAKMFDYIGQAENMDGVEKDLIEQKIISPGQTVGMHNITAKKRDHFVILENIKLSQRKRIESLCEADLALYEMIKMRT